MTGDRTARAPESRARVMAPNAALGGRYRARGVDHDIFIVRLRSMRWQVLDLTATEAMIVDTLEGFDDRFEQARALACDYASEKQAYYDGLRQADPSRAPERARRRRNTDRGRAGR
jgi:hypothetical protein